MSSGTIRNIVVTGDLVIDHHIYEGERHWPALERARGVAECRELGGADLVCRLLSETLQLDRQKAEQEIAAINKAIDDIKANEPGKAIDVPDALGLGQAVLDNAWKVALGVQRPDVMETVGDGHAVALWRPYPVERGSKKSVWRVAAPLGYGEPPKDARTAKMTIAEGQPRPSILVLDEAGFHFRSVDNRACWLLRDRAAAEPRWIVLKMARPLAQGDLWHELISQFSIKLVCVISAEDLRSECVSVTQGLSWERTVEDVCAAVEKNPVLKGLSNCRHLIVRFKSDGALWLHREADDVLERTLIFDPAGAEGMWDDRHDGKVIGYSSAMTVAIARALAHCVATKPGLEPDFTSAIKTGLAAGRDLLANGHGAVGEAVPAGFPASRLADVLTYPAVGFASLRLLPSRIGEKCQTEGEGRSLIELSQRPSGSHARSALAGLAHEYVLKGEEAIKRLPHARFGQMTTVDRVEIEALRGIRRQMLDYRDRSAGKKPLSIGVFGPPGAGKSFGVKQLAKEVFGSGAWIEFNLAQFDGPADLIGAFHQVRDLVLKGVTPVVFWDEFDSQSFRWLQYLLAPMQDGSFQEGQITHPIGKSVFVFAGGTSATFKQFGERAEQGKDEEKADFRLKKGPDFHSRLDGYYNVLGPNPRELEGQKGVPDPTDICYPLRRALLIRALLGCGPKDQLDFDPDLIDALLMVPHYRHGARSLEKLVSSLKSDDGGPIRRSRLPAAVQINMHVDATEFARLLSRNEGFRMSDVIEKIAASIQNSFWEESKAKKREIAARYNKPYDELDPIDKEDNRAAARRIPEVLALAGLGIAEEADEMQSDLARDGEIDEHILRQMERLAEAEHDGWMEQRRKNNWTYGKVRVNERKIHNLLIPFSQLPEDEKSKDRESVGNYRKQVTEAGYRLDWL